MNWREAKLPPAYDNWSRDEADRLADLELSVTPYRELSKSVALWIENAVSVMPRLAARPCTITSGHDSDTECLIVQSLIDPQGYILILDDDGVDATARVHAFQWNGHKWLKVGEHHRSYPVDKPIPLESTIAAELLDDRRLEIN